MENNIDKMCERIIHVVEKKYRVEILFGGVVGSNAMGLQNNLSDIDFAFVYRTIDVKTKIDKINEGNIEFHFYDLGEINNSIKMESDINNDDNQTIIFRIYAGKYIYDKNLFLRYNYKKIKETFILKNILYYYYSRIKGNYINYLNKKEVQVRKYLYSLHHIWCITWILQYNTNPPMDFLFLLEKYVKDEKLKKIIKKYYYLNKDEKFKSKKDLSVRINKEINSYIGLEIINIENSMKIIEDKLINIKK